MNGSWAEGKSELVHLRILVHPLLQVHYVKKGQLTVTRMGIELPFEREGS
jgi:hypothetical protein